MLLLALAAAVLPPVDQCSSDRTFVQFRRDLLRTIEKRDAKALLAAVADDIRVSFGDDSGRDDFVRSWQLDKPQKSRVWEELGTALRLGCTIEGDGRTAPSLGGQIGERDVFETLVALPGASLRRAPSGASPRVTGLKWDLLTIDKPWDGGRWIAVRLDDGRRGFILRSETRSPVDYRAWFEKRDGRWLMAAFLAGD